MYIVIMCPGLDPPENGGISSANNNFRRHTRFFCNIIMGFGLTQVSSYSRQCRGTDRSSIGYWTGVQPTCDGNSLVAFCLLLHSSL